MKRNAEKITVSAFSALFAAGAILMPWTGVNFYDISSYEALSTVGYFAVLVAAFVLIYLGSRLVDRPEYDRVVLLTTFMIYALICAYQSNNVWFVAGECAVLFGVCRYFFSSGSLGEKPGLPNKLFYVLVAAAGIYFAVFVSVEEVCRYLTFSTPTYDFGIFSQMFYNMRRSFSPETTVERDRLLSHFAVHFSPIYYLWLPFYAVFPSPVTLMVCQAVTLASGVVPIILIGKRLGFSKKSVLLFSLVYVFYPALAGGTFYDVHENKFLAPLLLWLIYFTERGSIAGTLIFSLGVCLVKEDAPIYVIFLMLFVVISKKGKRGRLTGLAALGLSAVYFAVVIALMNRFGLGIMSGRFSNFTEGGGLADVVINVVKNPARVIYEIFSPEAGSGDVPKPVFILQTLLPLGMLPFMGKRPERLILVMPYLLVNLMPSYVYQHNIFFQYTYGAFALLLYASMLNYKDMSPRAGRTVGVFALCASLLFTANSVYKKAAYLDYYKAHGDEYREMREALDEIPDEASVFATTFLCTELSGREELYDLNMSRTERRTDYVAVDLRYSENDEFFKQYQNDPAYEVIYYSDQAKLAIFKLIEK